MTSLRRNAIATPFLLPIIALTIAIGTTMLRPTTRWAGVPVTVAARIAIRRAVALRTVIARPVITGPLITVPVVTLTIIVGTVTTWAAIGWPVASWACIPVAITAGIAVRRATILWAITTGPAMLMAAWFIIATGFKTAGRAIIVVPALVGASVNFLRPCAFRCVHGLDAGADQAFDITQVSAFRAVTKRDCDASLACARRPPNPVDIAFWHVWQLEIDDMGYVIDVNATCSNIGRHQNVHAPAFETAERAVTLALAAVAMDCLSAEASFLKVQLNPVCAAFGAGKHDSAFQFRIPQDVRQHTAFGTGFDMQNVLCDTLNWFRTFRHRHFGRLVQEFVGQLADLAGHGGG